jgi:hypothetical protein
VSTRRGSADLFHETQISRIFIALGAYLLICARCLFLACALLATDAQSVQQQLDKTSLAWMQAVLETWEAVCRRDLRIPAEPLVDGLLR